MRGRRARGAPVEADHGRHAELLQQLRVVVRAEDAAAAVLVGPVAVGRQAAAGRRRGEEEEAVGHDGDDLAVDNAGKWNSG